MPKIFKTIQVEQSVYEELIKANALLQLMEGRKVSLSETIKRALEELPKTDLYTTEAKRSQ